MASSSRPTLTLVSTRRLPADILQELAIRAPKEFAALILLAQGILERLTAP